MSGPRIGTASIDIPNISCIFYLIILHKLKYFSSHVTFASIINSVSLLLVQWCLFLPTSFFVNDVPHGKCTTLILSQLHISLILVITMRCSSNMFLIYQPLQ